MKKLFLVLTTLSSLLVFSLATPAFAANPFEEIDCSGNASESAVCKERAAGDTGNPIAGPNGIINRVTRVVGVAAGVIAVIIIIIGGIRFITSSGDPQSVNGAKNTILYAVIGLIVIVLAQSIVIYVVSRL